MTQLHWEEHIVNANELKVLEDALQVIETLQTEIEVLKQNAGQLVKPTLKIEEVMSENCTCYKLGYSPLNDYASVKQK